MPFSFEEQMSHIFSSNASDARQLADRVAKLEQQFKALMQIASLPKDRCSWTDVREALPPVGVDVIIVDAHSAIRIAHITTEEERKKFGGSPVWLGGRYGNEGDTAIAWMPMPVMSHSIGLQLRK